MNWMPCLVGFEVGSEAPRLRLGHPLVDRYLEFVAARARPNTVLAAGYDLKVFFETVAKDPIEVTTADILGFITAQRGDGRVVCISGDGSGLSPRTIQRRLSTLSGLFSFLVARGDIPSNPVPRGLATRSSRRSGRGAPLMRAPRTLPRILEPAEVDALVGALRTFRDRAMIEAMVLGGLRRNETLGLRFADLNSGERRVFVAEGKGGHSRLVPISGRFFSSVSRYLEEERPPESVGDRLFVVLKGPNRGRPLTPKGLEQIMRGARERAGLTHATCHELRHTCLTRLREAGMSLEAVQAQAGHRSIESTRLYLHLANGWLADEYRRAVDRIDSESFAHQVTQLGEATP